MLSNPTIAFLVDSPDPVHQGNVLALTANTVLDADGDTITSVEFYRSVDAAFDVGDTLLDAGVQSGLYDWQWTGVADWTAGTWYYFAVANNDILEQSAPAMSAGKVNALPVISSLAGAPEPISPGDILTLTAGGVTDPDGSVQSVDFYHDINDDGLWDVGDTFLGRDSDGLDGWSLDTLVSWTAGGYFARAQDNDGAFSTATYGTVDQKPTIEAVTNDPNPIIQGQWVTFTASNVVDSDGTVTTVAFYRDVFDSGHYNPGLDIWMGDGTDMGGGNWDLTVLATWEPDVSPMYFAIAQDDASPVGLWGDPVWTLNQNPSIDEVAPDPNPVPLGSPLDLMAYGVTDSDGFIQEVWFSVHDQTTNWPENGAPTLEYQDTSGVSGWNWDIPLVDWQITDIVKADFDQDGDMDLAVSVDVTSTAGVDFVSVLTNNGFGTFLATSVVDLYAANIGANFNPQAIVAGDFDNDGYPDLATANYGDPTVPEEHPDYTLGHVSVLLNDQTGHFTTHTDFDVDFRGDEAVIHPDAIAAADFTADGNVDLLLASSYDNEMPLLLGDGTGSFTLDRVYSYGTSRWRDGTSWWLMGSGPPQTALATADMVAAELDYNEFGETDVAMTGPNGPFFMFNWMLDTLGAGYADNLDPFDPGNVIGRAMETGIVGDNPFAQSMETGFAYRTGNEWDWGLGLRSRTDDFFPQWLHDGDVDFYHVNSSDGRNLTVTTFNIVPPDEDPPPPAIYVYVYDSNGTAVDSGVLELATLYTFTTTLPAAGDYYVALAGFPLIASDYVDPFTGYWVNDDVFPESGNDVEYLARFDLGARPVYVEGVDEPIFDTDLWPPEDGDAGIQDGQVLFRDENAGTTWDAEEDVWVDGSGGGVLNGTYDEEYQIWDNGDGWDTLVGTAGVSGLVLFDDVDADTFFDYSEEVWADVGTTPGVYDAGDTQVWDGGDAVWTTPLATAGIAGNVYVSDLDTSTTYTAGDEVWNDPREVTLQNGQWDAVQETQLSAGTAWTTEDGDAGIMGNLVWFDTNSNAAWDDTDFVWADELGSTTTTGVYDSGIDTPVYNLTTWYPVTGDLGTAGDVYYWDANFNGIWDAGEDLWADTGSAAGEYDATDTQIYDAGAWDPAVGAVGSQAYVLFYDANTSDTWDVGEPIWAVRADPTANLAAFGAGDSIAFADFMEDDYNNNQNIEPHGDLLDTDLAISNSLTDEAIVLLGDRQVGAKGRDGYAGFFAGLYSAPTRSVAYELGRTPTSVATYNVDADMTRDTSSDPDWDWAQGSSGETVGEFYNDLVLTNADGTLTFLINDAEHSGNFGVHEFEDSATWYDPDFDDPALNYELANYTLEGPLQNPIAAVGDDFNGDGIQSLAIVEQYGLATLRNTYPYHQSEPLDLDQYEAEWPQVGLPLDFQSRYSVITPAQMQRDVTYFAIAFDEDYGWPDNLQYEGYSSSVSVNVLLNQMPTVWTLTANREALEAGNGVTLTADGVQDMDGFVAAVEFYVDDGDAVFDPTTDTLLGVDLNGAGGWTWAGTLAAPSDIFWARALDEDGDYGQPVGAMVNTRATIASLAVDATFYADDDELIVGAAPANGTLGYATNVLFFDADVNNRWDTGEELWEDENPNGFYDEESLIWDDGDGWDTLVGTTGLSGIVLFTDFNYDDVFDWNEGVFVDANSNGVYDTGETVLHDGNGAWVPQQDDAGTAGNVYLSDLDSSTGYSSGDEVWADASRHSGDTAGDYDGIQEAHVYDGGDGWDTGDAFQGAVANLLSDDVGATAGEYDVGEAIWAEAVQEQASLLLIAVDVVGGGNSGRGEALISDAGDGWDTPIGTVGRSGGVLFYDLDANTLYDYDEPVWADLGGTAGQYDAGDTLISGSPTIGDPGIVGNVYFADLDASGGYSGGDEVWADSPSYAGDNAGVYDGLGDIYKVQFYRDSNFNGVFDPKLDYLIGRGTNVGNLRGGAASDYTLAIPAVDWGPGSHKYFAVAQDYFDDWSSEVGARNHVMNLPPDIGGLVDSPDPVTQGDMITLTALGVEDPFGEVHSVEFYLDTNGDDLIDVGDTLLGVDSSNAGGWNWTGVVTWAGGTHTYMARVVDNYGAVTDPSTNANAKTDGDVNLRPTIGSLADAPDPVFQTYTLTLTAGTVADSDGTVTDVKFYRDSNASGSLEVGVDDELDSAFTTDLGGGTWQWQGAAGWPVGDQMYFARAQDNDGGYSLAVFTTGRGENLRPVIGGLTLDVDPVTEGNPLTLVAENVTDGNGTIDIVEFYRDSNGNGNLDVDIDEQLGEVTSAETDDYSLAIAVNWSPGLHLYFAQARDNDGIWSDVAFAQGFVNGRPEVAALSASPDPLVPGDVLTLEATGVTDSDGSIVQVAFYRDTNGDGVFQEDQDDLLGNDTDELDGWTLSQAEATGVGTYFARAQDDRAGWSLAASVTLGWVPTIGGLADAPDPVHRDQLLVLTATDVMDVDGTIDEVRFYRDADGDGELNTLADQLLGTDTTPGDGWFLAIPPTWGGGTHTYFARARDNEENWSPDGADAPSTVGYVDFEPEIAALTDSPDPVTRGESLTLTATGVTDADGTVTEVEFYLDADGNGTLEADTDTLLERDTSAAGGWTVTIPTLGWSLGSQTYFARAQDDITAWSDPVSTTGEVNGGPLVGSLNDTPDPVIRGQDLTLTALGVNDPDGLVQEVEFYHDTNANGSWDPADAVLGSDTDGTDGWILPGINTSAFTVGAHVYFARARDDLSAWGAAATAYGTVTTTPSVTVALAAGSDTGVSNSDGITNDNTPTYDITVNDAGGVDIDWDGNGITDYSFSPVAAGTYQYTMAAVPDGSFDFDVTFTDTGSNVATDSAPTTVDTAAPSSTVPPDLQAASDNGASNTDNYTSILSPTFDVVPTDTYFRFYRDATLISGSYETGTTYTAVGQSVGGPYLYTLRSVDAAGNLSPMSVDLPVTFYAGPAVPPAPDLQAGSDSGSSDTDNITNAMSAVFDVSPAGANFRFYRNGVLISGTETGTTYTAVAEPEGTWDYTVTSWTAPNLESDYSAPLTVTIDRTAPTVTDGNIDAWLSVDGGTVGIAEFGDVLTVTWDSSLGGDGNTDLASATVSLSDFAGPSNAALYDDGTHGDAIAGDEVYTLDYTIGSGELAGPSPAVAVTATDIAGNESTAADTSTIQVETKLLALWQWGDVKVAIYDVDGNSDVDPANIEVKLGKGGSISSIKIGGRDSAEGLGIAISGASSVKSIKDSRKGTPGELGFIVSDSPIGSISLKSGIAGYDINGDTLADVVLPADIDGDGETDDPTAIYSESYVGKVKVAGAINGDVWIAGTNGRGYSLKQLDVKNGGFAGDMVLAGNAGKVRLSGDLEWGSSIGVAGSLDSLELKGRESDINGEVHIKVGGLFKKLKVQGDVDGLSAPWGVQILAGDFGQIDVRGHIAGTRILAGADLGDDWALGGTDADADTFGQGTIRRVKVRGYVAQSTIAAGLVSTPGGAFDLAWAASTNAFVNGSWISKIDIRGTLTATDPAHGIGAYGVAKYKITGLTIHPLVFTEV